MMKDYGGAFLAAFVLCLALFAAGLFLSSCAGPRSAQFCTQNGQWVKCPQGVKPGTDLNKIKAQNERK